MADSPASNPGAAAKQVVTQLRGLWTKLPKLGRIGAVAVLALIVGGLAYAALASGPAGWVSASPSALNTEDAAELASLLAARNIPHRVSADGKRVEVPAAKGAEAQLIASTNHLPRGGTGLESFEETQLGQTDFGEKVKYQRAQQGELERSIESLGPIESARVHIAPGKRGVFRETDEPPTASVALRVRPGVRLTAEQVRGVKQLVASSIVGLTVERVALIDQHGDLLSAEPDTGHEGDDAAALEASIGDRLHGMLEKIVGPGHVAVVVSVEMDRSRVSQSEEIYDPNRTAIRSSNKSGVAGGSAAINSGIAGVQGNLPGAPAGGGGTGSAGAPVVGTEIVNYEITRTVRTTDLPTDKIKRVHLAILLDHRDGAALPAAQIDEIAKLARQAAGLDESRGDALEIQSFAFAPEQQVAPALPPIEPAPLLPPLPVPLPLVGAGAAGLAFIVIAVMVMRGRRRRRRATMPVLALPAPLAELERALDTPRDGSALPALAAAASDQRSLEERVLGSVRADIPRAARVLATWLIQPDPRPGKS